MSAMPQTAYSTFDMKMRAKGVDVRANCFENVSSAFAWGWGRGMKHAVEVAGEYRASDNAAAFVENGKYCRDDAAFFKPSWSAVHDWIRYGMLEPPHDVAPTVSVSSDLPTIANVMALAPSAYDVFDMGASRCADGTDGHALHFIAKRSLDKHPLMDAVVQTSTMRLCMVRLRLVNATAVGSGAKGDVALDLGQAGRYWMVTHARTALSLRIFGASLKSLVFDMTYGNMAFPASIPASDFPEPR